MCLAGSSSLVAVKHLALQVAEAEAEEQERAAQLVEQAKTVAAVTRDAALARWRRLKVGQGWKCEGQGRTGAVHGKQPQHRGACYWIEPITVNLQPILCQLS